MPSYYTSVIEEGGAFEELVCRCVRGMALMTRLRDKPAELFLEQIKPSAYYKERAEESQKELDQFMDMNKEGIIEAFEQKVKEKEEHVQKEIHGISEKRELYNKMLVRAMAWEAPQGEHFSYLKSSMIACIEESMEELVTADEIRNANRLADPTQTKEEQAITWYKINVEILLKDIKRSQERHQKELDDVEEINEFLQKLHANLAEYRETNSE